MNELVLAIAVVLLPGLIATIICERIVVHVRPWPSFKYIIYSFVLGVSCYFFLQFLVWLISFIPSRVTFLPSLTGKLDVWSIATGTSGTIDLAEIAAATALSVPVAFIAALIVNKKSLNHLASITGVSRKYGDENLFSYFLNSDDVWWVYIRDFDRKLTYQGRVQAFSETDEMQEIVLNKVTVFGYDNSSEYYSVPSLYLCRRIGELVIEQIPPERMGPADERETS